MQSQDDALQLLIHDKQEIYFCWLKTSRSWSWEEEINIYWIEAEIIQKTMGKKNSIRNYVKLLSHCLVLNLPEN